MGRRNSWSSRVCGGLVGGGGSGPFPSDDESLAQPCCVRKKFFAAATETLRAKLEDRPVPYFPQTMKPSPGPLSRLVRALLGVALYFLAMPIGVGFLSSLQRFGPGRLHPGSHRVRPTVAVDRGPTPEYQRQYFRGLWACGGVILLGGLAAPDAPGATSGSGRSERCG